MRFEERLTADLLGNGVARKGAVTSTVVPLQAWRLKQSDAGPPSLWIAEAKAGLQGAARV